jgi:hypothetical protein
MLRARANMTGKAPRFSSGGSSPPPFTPLTLFSGGQYGAWYDFTDMSTLFQDAARTIPVTAAGQTVAGVTDKSGRGLHLSADAGTLLVQLDANGHLYLDFTGSQVLKTAITPTGTALAQAMSWNQLSKPGSTNFWSYLCNPTVDGLAGQYVSSSGGLVGGQYNDAGATLLDVIVNDPIPGGGAMTYANPHVMTTRCNAGKWSLDSVTGTYGVGGTVTLSATTQYNLGCLTVSGNNRVGFSTGRVYGAIFRTSEWTDAEDLNLRTWMAARYA